jgi:Tfp pilus assembly protein PilF
VIFSRLAVIYLDQKNFSDAIDSLSEALRLNPNSAVNYFNLSYAYNAEGDNKEATIAARKALRLDPKNSKYKKWLEQLRIKPF